MARECCVVLLLPPLTLVSTIFTGGNDCLVRIHNAEEPDSEPGFHDDHGESVTSLAATSEYLVTASVDNVVRRFTFPGNEHDGFITRSAGVPIRWVSVDRAGERVAVCSE
jgi:chromosome transmission fidelity protein 4